MGYQEIKLEWPEIPRLKLKLLFLIHLILISWSSLGKEWIVDKGSAFFPPPKKDILNAF